ncbi:MAG: NAD-dependent epimerase/dehydratase family protein [Candidatus Woesearchaeota archaeon]
MKVLIIGGTGFLGNNISPLIKADVYTMSRSGSKKKHVKADILNLEKVKKIIPKYDVIINLTGLSPIKEPSKTSYSDVHVLGVRNILFSLNKNQRFIHVSAIGANKKSKNEYLRTKGKAEQIILSSKTNTLIIRPSMIFGEGSELFKQIKNVPFFPNFKFQVQPVFVEDIAKIINKHLKTKKGIIEVAGPEKMTFYDFVKKYKSSKNKVCLKVPMFLFKPFFYLLTRLNLFGLSKNQWLLISKNNISKKPYSFNYTRYGSWLQKL